jgi:hypothetical protein
MQLRLTGHSYHQLDDETLALTEKGLAFREELLPDLIQALRQFADGLGCDLSPQASGEHRQCRD